RMPLSSNGSSRPCCPSIPARRWTVRWRGRAPSPVPATWCCCPPPAPRTISSATSSTAERPSAPSSRHSRDPPPELSAVADAARRPLGAGPAGGGPGASRSGAGARLARAGDGLFGERGDRGREAGQWLLLPRAPAGGGGGGPGGDGCGRPGGLSPARPHGLSDARAEHRPAGAGPPARRGHGGGRGAALAPGAGGELTARRNRKVHLGGVPGLLPGEEAREGGHVLHRVPAAPGPRRAAGGALHGRARLRQLGRAAGAAGDSLVRRRNEALLPGGLAAPRAATGVRGHRSLPVSLGADQGVPRSVGSPSRHRVPGRAVADL